MKHDVIVAGLAVCLLLVGSNAAHGGVCPNAFNLQANCGFNTDLTGYTPQAPGDTLGYEASAGDTAPGAMRVVDTNGDGGTDAEAQACVNLTASRVYSVGASFRAVNAGSCYVGWDEFQGMNCTASNGNFQSSTPVAVNGASFTRFSALKSVGDLVQSVELVILCATSDQSNAEFLADDVFLIPENRFVDGFESVP